MHDPISRNYALADLKELLPKLNAIQNRILNYGVQKNWFLIQLPWHVKQAIRNGHPNPKLLRALANVINQTAPATILEKFLEWVALS